MRIRMTKTMQGSPDGIRIETYEAGQEYDIEGPLLDLFFAEKAAVKATARKQSAPEKKSIKRAPENK